MQLEGTTALVTGSAHRLGKHLALGLANEGCNLAVHYHDAEREAEDTVAEILAMGTRAVSVQADLADTNAIREMFRSIDGSFGQLDLLVNSAAILESGDLLEVNEESWRRSIGLNLKGAFFVLQEAAIRMRSVGRGSIVNISDTAGHRPWERFPLHSISKAGLEMLTQVAALALAPEIRVNSVIPGPTLKPLWMPDVRWVEVTGRIPLGQTVPTKDVVDAVVFLMKNEYLTGHSLRVDGGDLLI